MVLAWLLLTSRLNFLIWQCGDKCGLHNCENHQYVSLGEKIISLFFFSAQRSLWSPGRVNVGFVSFHFLQGDISVLGQAHMCSVPFFRMSWSLSQCLFNGKYWISDIIPFLLNVSLYLVSCMSYFVNDRDIHILLCPCFVWKFRWSLMF